MTGFVFAFTAIAVKPLFDATFSPFFMVSLSSKPGSPKETLVSNHPHETCKLSKEITEYSGFSRIKSSIFSSLP